MDRLTQIQKVKTLLRNGCKLNDAHAAMYYQIYFVHQVISVLRKEGWAIDNIYDCHHKLITYKLISEPVPVTANEF